MSPDDEVVRLKKELIGLFGHMHRIRKELAAIGTPGGERDYFTTMSDLLDGICEEVEIASNKIMDNMEAIDKLISYVRTLTFADQEVQACLDRISEHGNAVFEACTFQDLTSQRVVKITRSLKFIEERVKCLIYMWGREELAAVVTEYRLEEAAEETDPEKKLLNGPQRASVAVTQEEIDQLFG